MILRIPITGTVLVEGSIHGNGLLKGDPNDGIRPIPIDLGNVSWQMVDVDLENEEMVIEVMPGEVVSEPTGENDAEGNPIYTSRATTQQEKAGFLQHAQDLINTRTKDELYVLAQRPKLKRPSSKD
ncbi:hypothetical protein LCGC14_2969000 [marine sediment metagenome]|uniref:Uncharacterized protein n=1 Tax=marine sediment metagenome TaxID=412755 RepID=A0A0F8XAX6_9ZZZZ